MSNAGRRQQKNERILFAGTTGAIGAILLMGSINTAASAPPARSRTQATGSKPAQNVSPPPASSGPKVTTFGKVRISDYAKFGGRLDLSSIRFSGPNTKIESTEAGSRSRILVHADEVTVASRDSNRDVSAMLIGHVRYSIVQQTANGTRTLQGTAGRAVYKTKTRIIEFYDGVDASLADPQLVGPGTLTTGHAVVDMSSALHRYTLSGAPSRNTVALTLKSKPDKAGTVRTYPIRARGFDTAVVQVGERAAFTGSGTTVDFASPTESTQARLAAGQIEANFKGTPAVLARAEARRDLRYRVERAFPAEAGKIAKSPNVVDGTSETLLLVPDEHRLELGGGVRASLLSPEELDGPGQLVAQKISVHTIAPYSYTLDGGPNESLIAFTPKPQRPTTPAGSKPESTSVGTDFGSIRVTNFDTGNFQPGQKLALAGPNLRLDAIGQEGTKTTLQSPRMTADFANNTLTQALAQDGVKFHVERPARGKRGRQALQGEATQATFMAGENEEIRAAGPYRATLVDAQLLQEPAQIRGGSGESIILRRVEGVYEFDADAPNRGSVVNIRPRETKPKPSSTPKTSEAGKAPASAPTASPTPATSPQSK